MSECPTCFNTYGPATQCVHCGDNIGKKWKAQESQAEDLDYEHVVNEACQNEIENIVREKRAK